MLVSAETMAKQSVEEWVLQLGLMMDRRKDIQWAQQSEPMKDSWTACESVCWTARWLEDKLGSEWGKT